MLNSDADLEERIRKQRIFVLSFSNAKPVREKITKTNLFTEDKVNILHWLLGMTFVC